MIPLSVGALNKGVFTRFAITTMIAFMLIGSASSITVAEEANITVEDPQLEKAIRQALYLTSEGPITKKRLEQLDSLFIVDQHISSLKGLEQARNLRSLTLPCNKITDLNPLKELIQLQYLNLYNNLVTDISPLSNLTNLTQISFDNYDSDFLSKGPTNNCVTGSSNRNAIVNILPLKQLKKLKSVRIADNTVGDISPLLNLVNMKEVVFGASEVRREFGPIIKELTKRNVRIYGSNINSGQVLQVPESTPLRVYMDGQRLNFNLDPQIVNGATFVPFRAFFEYLKAKVDWREESRSIVAVKDDTVVSLAIGSQTAIINNEERTLDAAPYIDHDSTYVPLRLVSEAFGFDVQWLASTKSIYLFSGSTRPAPQLLPLQPEETEESNPAAETMEGIRVVESQSFPIQLDKWGEVNFVSGVRNQPKDAAVFH